MLIDAHAHLADAEFDENREAVITRAKAQGVRKICLICSSFEAADQAFKMHAEDPDFFDIAIGFHPSDVFDNPTPDYQRLIEYLQKPGVVAVGEIGLDFYWHKDNKEAQRLVFTKQIEIANQLELPIQIHARDALQETYDLLKAHPSHSKGMMHCYSGSPEMAKEFVKLGYLISLGGPLTFKNAKAPKEVVKEIPVSFLMSETDSPYLTPHPFRGKPNESMYVKYVVEEMANLKEISISELTEQLTENYKRLYHAHK